MTRQITHRLAQLATVWALFVFARRLAAHHPDGATAAEAEYLTLLVATVLLGLALSARSAPAIVSCGTLIGIALCLPAAQGTRATLIVALLASTLAWCTWRAFASPRNVAFSEVGGIAIAWQALMRSDRLLDLHLEPGAVVWLVALPLIAAAAALSLSRRQGAIPTLVLLAALFVLIPGLGIVPVAVLVVAAALGARPEVSLPSDAVAIGACALAIWREPEVAPALLFLVTALALRHARWRWLAPAAALVWTTTQILQSGSFEPAATMLGWVLLGLPLALLGGPDRRPLALTGLALAVAAAGGEPAVLAPAVALLALAVPTEGGAARRLQAAWSLVLLTAVSMAAAYPWLRRPLVDPPSQIQAVPVLALALLALAGAAIAARGKRRRLLQFPSWAGPLAFVILLALTAWLAPRPPSQEPIVLSADSPRWQTTVDLESVQQLTVDSFLARGGQLAPRQPVARVRLVAADGEARELTLRQGDHTADWAARRLGRDDTPEPWLSWVAPDGSLAQRYRAIWTLESPLQARQLEIVLLEELPTGMELALLRVVPR